MLEVLHAAAFGRTLGQGRCGSVYEVDLNGACMALKAVKVSPAVLSTLSVVSNPSDVM